MFIQTISEADAEGKLLEIYQGDLKNLGYVPNHARVFSLRPEVLEAWRAFQGSIRKNLHLRRYELVTLAAAMALNCRYCLLAHGSILIKNGVSLEQLRMILTNFNEAGLEAAEVAMMSTNGDRTYLYLILVILFDRRDLNIFELDTFGAKNHLLHS
jgi:AhpD family alkylhydroperoxidase